MKCLSLWQPWAALMVLGKKRNETRSWYLSHRGPMAIHAAKMWNNELETMCCQPEFVMALSSGNTIQYKNSLKQNLAFGAIVGVVDVIDCVRITAGNAPAMPERIFGDYTPGRFAIITENARRLREPITYRGMQGLFNIPDDIFESSEFLQDIENADVYQKLFQMFQDAKRHSVLNGPEFDRLERMRLLVNAWNAGKRSMKLINEMKAAIDSL